MKRPLCTLIVEDTAADAELMVMHLEEEGFQLDWSRVETEADYLAALGTPPDLILADWSLPQFSGLRALRRMRERGLDIPFIIVSGSIGEEAAIDALREGAADYVLKDRPARLGQAVRRALEEHHLRVEKEQAEAALRASEEKHRLLFDHAGLAIGYFTLDGQIVAFNHAAAALLGGNPEDYVGKTMGELFGEQVGAVYLERIKAVMVSPDNLMYEDFSSLPTGDRWLLSTFSKITDAAGSIIGIQILTNDITGRKQAEQALRESEERLRTVLENMPVMLDALDEDLNIIVWNRECERVTGYTADEIIGHPNVSELLYPDPQYREHMQTRLVASEDYRNWEWETTCKDGSVKTIAWFNISRQYPVPGWARWGIGVDITGRKRAEAAERDARILAEALAETASALIRVPDFAGVMNAILENVAHVVPHDAANIMLIEGDQAHIVYWRGYRPEQVPFLQEHYMSVAETPHLRHVLNAHAPFLASYTEQHPGWTRQPHTDWVKSYIAAPIRSHGNVVGLLNVDSGVPGFFTDDHARRLQSFADQASVAIERAQLHEDIHRHAAELERRVEDRTAQLNHARERIETILNSSSDIIILCLPDGRVDQVNPAFDIRFGCKPEEVYNQPLFNLAAAKQRSLLEKRFAEVLTSQQPQRLEMIAQCKSGEAFEADVVLSPIVQNEVHLVGVLCSLRDITERKRMESQLRQMLEHEMELGELKSRYISMAAHDLRSPLAAIKTIVETLEKYHDRLSEEQQQTRFGRIHQSIRTMVDLLNDTLTLGQAGSGKLTFEPQPLDLIRFAEELITEFHLTTAGAHRIEFSTRGAAGMVEMDPKLLRHILGNLLSNALKYSPADRPVSLAVHFESHAVTFRIQDGGIGIPQAEQARLFEAFHRASNVGGTPGTGLGLAIVKQSIELHGGTIDFESEEGVGTAFTVVIPQTPSQGGQES